MEKDTRLINIYLKIHHRRTLTIDDLNYLAQYDPECFEKTCKNVVYNIPEAKPIMLPEITEAITRDRRNRTQGSLQKDAPKPKEESLQKDEIKSALEPEIPEWQSIERVLENLKHLEAHDFPVADIDAERVKSLLGNLYMELLFPHNDNYPFMIMTDDISAPSFDKRA